MGGTVDGEPFVEVFSFGEEDCLFEVSGSEDGGCVTFELGCFTAFLHRLFRFKCIPCTCVSITHQRWRRKRGGVHCSQEGHCHCGGDKHRDDATPQFYSQIILQYPTQRAGLLEFPDFFSLEQIIFVSVEFEDATVSPRVVVFVYVADIVTATPSRSPHTDTIPSVFHSNRLSFHCKRLSTHLLGNRSSRRRRPRRHKSSNRQFNTTLKRHLRWESINRRVLLPYPERAGKVDC